MHDPGTDTGDPILQGDTLIPSKFTPKPTILQYAVVLCLFILLVSPKLNQPVTDDEIYEIDNAERILSGEPIRVFVPPLYDYALAFSLNFLGREPWVMRLVGLCSAVATLFILMTIIRRFYPETPPQASFLAGALLVLNPAFIQGALLVHIDNTLLVPFTLLWVWFLSEYARTNFVGDLAWVGLFLSLALFAKFTTPLLLILAGFLFILLNHPGKLLAYSLMTALSLLVFLLGWWIFSKTADLSFMEPFIHAVQRGALYSEVLTKQTMTLSLNVLTLVVWFTPLLLLSFAVALPAALRDVMSRRDPAALLLIAAAAICSYVTFSTVNHGFPKYFMPALPLLLGVAVYPVGKGLEWRQWPVRRWIFPFAGATAFFFVFLEDPILLLRYDLRETEVLGTGKSEILITALGQIFLCMLPLALWFLRSLRWPLWRRLFLPTFPTHLLVMSLAFSAALSLKQAGAPYQTNYSYGERGTMELHAFLQKHVQPNDKILATKDILYRLGRGAEYVPKDVWVSPSDLLQRLNELETRFLIISIPSISLTTHKILRDHPELRETISTRFSKRKIGTYIVYERDGAT
jgi:hypothetical protein